MNPSVLVVDDSRTMRMIVSGIFASLPDWHVSSAENGQAALQLAQQQHFDLIVTDINMPVMDGLSLVRGLRELAGYCDTPVLILTTEDDQSRKLQAADLGVYAWIHKPVDPQDLIELAKELLQDGPAS
jgi:two-component system chemotaxis response regulator CheY